MNPAEGGEGAYNCYIKRCVNLCRTNCTKCPYMGKQGGGTKWLTIHKIKNLQLLQTYEGWVWLRETI